jgi:peptidyl-prolyl cis-trans isomerase D
MAKATATAHGPSMISFFRRALSSWFLLGLLGLVMIAFIVTGVGGRMGMGPGGGSSESIARVGGEDIHSAEAASRVQLQLEQARREQPGLDINAFVKAGGVDQTVQQLIAAHAMEAWARKQGMAISDRLIDGEIASIGAFKGPTGKFDEQAFRSLLAQRRITESQLRADIRGDALRRLLLAPVAAGASPPVGVVGPYTGLLLESRSGTIGIVPSAAMGAGTPPTDTEIADYYNRNIARYTIPERRILRYAPFGYEHLHNVGQASEAEIAAYYKANAATYGDTEIRTLSQVILPDQNAAKALAAKVKGGISFAQAAQQAGFAPGDIALGAQSREAFAKLASPAAAAAAYAVPQGGTTDPVKSELGWHVIHVDAIKRTAGKPLAAVHGEIAATLEKQKLDEALSAMVTTIEDAVADGSSFDDIVKSQKLEVVTTPPVLANGTAPDLASWTAPPELSHLLRTAFEASPDDDPTVETIAAGNRYALLSVTKIVPATPAPLAKIRDQVVRDLAIKRASDRARAIATAIVSKANAGTPLAKAFAESGVRLPPVEKASGRQLDLSRSDRPVPPPLALMFSMAAGKTKLLAAPNNQGWFVVHLDSITPGDPKTAPGLVEATRSQFARVLGDEYAEQFTNAVKKDIGVEKNDAAVARLKKQLVGGSAGQ